MRTRILGLSLVLTACGGGHPAPPLAPKPVAAPPATSTSATPATTSTLPKGKTLLHPLVSWSWVANDALELEKDLTLYVGASGARWLVRMTKAPTPEDPDAEKPVLEGATTFAPEALVAVRRRGKGLLLVGESGATYPVDGPLAALGTRRKPNEAMRSVAVGKAAMIGVTEDGRALRSLDDGNTWSSITLPPSQTIPLAVAGSVEGEVGLLAAPGRLLGSFDDGASFQPLKTSGLAAVELSVGADHHVWVSTMSPGGGKLGDGLTYLSERRARLTAAGLELGKSAPSRLARPAPDGEDDLGFADAVRAGTAAWTGLRYLELRTTADEASLRHAVVVDNGKVSSLPAIPGTEACEIPTVAAEGSFVVAVCVRVDHATVFRSADAGKTFTADGVFGFGDRPLRAWVTANGSMLLDGACLKPGMPDCGEGMLVKPAGQKAWSNAKLPPGRKISALAANDERVVTVASDDDSLLHLLVSKDGGRTFADALVPDLPEGRPAYDLPDLALDGTQIVAVGDGHRFYSADDGKTFEVTPLPFDPTWISFGGAHGLATAGLGQAWETRDHGKTWGPVQLPPGSGGGGTMPVACSALGCILGDLAIREGWEEPPPSPPEAPSAAVVATHAPLLSCASSGEAVEIGEASRPEIEPTADVAWMTTTEIDGALEVLVQPKKGKLQHVPLLPKAKALSGTRRVQSADGVLVVRAPRNAPEGKKLVDVELAWWVAATGKVHRATVPAAAPPLGKFGTPSGLATFVPGWGALLHGSHKDAASFLAKENGAVAELTLPKEFPSLPRWFGRRKGTTTTLFGVGNTYRRERVIAFVELPDAGTSRVWTWSAWPRMGGRVQAEVSFAADRAIVAWPGTPELAARTFSLAFGDVDPPEPTSLPTAKELLKPCTASSGPRFELPFVNGARTPLIVEHEKSKMYHATSAVVGRGTKADACLVSTLAATNDSNWTLLGSDGAHGFTHVRGKKRVLLPITCQKSDEKLPARFELMPGFKP